MAAEFPGMFSVLPIAFLYSFTIPSILYSMKKIMNVYGTSGSVLCAGNTVGNKGGIGAARMQPVF